MHSQSFTETLAQNEGLVHPVPATAIQEKDARTPRHPAQEHVEQLARQALAENPPYAFHFKHIAIHFAEGVLTLRGRVHTFYMKQVLQSRLGDLEGVERIDNQVDVVSTTGLSSVRPK